jgi:hypothetical protein
MPSRRSKSSRRVTLALGLNPRRHKRETVEPARESFNLHYLILARKAYKATKCGRDASLERTGGDPP